MIKEWTTLQLARVPSAMTGDTERDGADGGGKPVSERVSVCSENNIKNHSQGFGVMGR